MNKLKLESKLNSLRVLFSKVRTLKQHSIFELLPVSPGSVAATFHFRALILSTCILLLSFLLSCSKFSAEDPDKLQGVAWLDGASSSNDSASSSLLSSSPASSSSASDIVAISSSSSSSDVASSAADAHSYGILTDTRNGVSKSYKTIQIHGQTWMAENLNYGIQVFGASSNADQSMVAGIEKYCYGELTVSCESDGGLYQWAEAMALSNVCNNSSCVDSIKIPHQGICPSGWHIPSSADWDSLVSSLGTAADAGAKMKLNATVFPGWNLTIDNDGNSSGFSAYPAGLRFDVGGFGNRGSSALFWESTESDALNGNNRNLDASKAILYTSNDAKTSGFSVRCIQNAP